MASEMVWEREEGGLERNEDVGPLAQLACCPVAAHLSPKPPPSHGNLGSTKYLLTFCHPPPFLNVSQTHH